MPSPPSGISDGLRPRELLPHLIPTPPLVFFLLTELFNLNTFLLEIALKARSFVPGRGKGMTFPEPLMAAVVVVAAVAVVAEVLHALLCSAVPWLAQR